MLPVIFSGIFLLYPVFLCQNFFKFWLEFFPFFPSVFWRNIRDFCDIIWDSKCGDLKVLSLPIDLLTQE